MAQTTRLMSFGPILVISILPVSASCRLQLYKYITLAGISKHERNIYKTYLWPKRRKTRCLSPFSSSLPNPSLIYLLKPIYTIVQLITKGNQRKTHLGRLASFGPVLIVSAYPVAYIVIRTYR